MNYYNELSELLFPAVVENPVNIFAPVTFMGEVSVEKGLAVGAIEEAFTLVNDNLT